MPKSSKCLLNQSLIKWEKVKNHGIGAPNVSPFITSVSDCLNVEDLICDQYGDFYLDHEPEFLNHALKNIIREIKNIYWQHLEETAWDKRKATGLTILELETILVNLGAKSVLPEEKTDD